ncbi:hypothetical protein HK096_004362 [Nowakowskiella sp. JEL0078]|nr:hypothetical protein HK096_004362 [Nowakowskiella sp. JEL0078]
MRLTIPQSFSELDSESKNSVKFRNDAGNTVEIQVLDHKILRVKHVPSAAVSLPTSYSLEAVGPHSYSGVSRNNVADFFPLPSISINRQDNNKVINLNSNSVNVSVSLKDDDLVLSWRCLKSGSLFLQDLPHRAYEFDKVHGVSHFIQQQTGDLHYGLGEQASPLVLNNRRLRLEATDSMGYNPQKTNPLYKFVPFYITLNEKTGIAHGIFYDSLSTGVMDFGLEIDAFWGSFRYFRTDYGILDYYVLFGPSVEAVVEQFACLVGRPALGPKYSLGYLASSMGYAEDGNAQALIEKFPDICRKFGIPCDLLHLSSGYTVDAKTGARNVFTWNKKRFPDAHGLFSKLRASGIKTVANIKPWLLCAHPNYQELKDNHGFIWDPEEDLPSQTRLWSAGAGESGLGSYVDFTSVAGFNFWKSGVKSLLEVGLDGMWNDNNEMNIQDDLHTFAMTVFDSKNSVPAGVVGRPLQNFMMSVASATAMLEHAPKKRPLLVTRSSMPGSHRWACQSWSGDNYTSWDTLQHNIPMGLTAGLSLFAIYGHDVGGFAGPQPSPELLTRWVQNGIFNPRFCIHSWKTEGVTEPWMYPEVLPIIRDAIHLRYRLIPYIYNLWLEAHSTGHPVIRPTLYHFQSDPQTHNQSFEFMLGPHLLVASVYTEGARTRLTYLPGPEESWCDVWTGQWYKGGKSITTNVTLETHGALFAKAGALVPTGKLMDYVGAEPDTDRIFWAFPPLISEGGTKSEYVLVEDDGESIDAPQSWIRVWMDWSESGVVTVGVNLKKNDFALPFKHVWFVLPHCDSRLIKSSVESNLLLEEKYIDGRHMVGIPL